MRYLVVEDHIPLAQAMIERIRVEGHVADHAESLRAARAYLENNDYEMVMLDIGLPDGDGLEFLQRMRRERNGPLATTPVIMLTARSTVSDRIGSLDSGADDYVVKPFDFDELMARCRAIVRRRAGQASPTLHFADITLHPQGAQLCSPSGDFTLRKRELRLMELFFTAPQRILSKEYLHQQLFGLDDDASDNAIEVYIGRLRKKLVGSRAAIDTVRGVGYRLVCCAATP